MRLALREAESKLPFDLREEAAAHEVRVESLADRMVRHIESLVPRGRARCLEIGGGDAAIGEAIQERLPRTDWQCVDVPRSSSALHREPRCSEYRAFDGDTLPFGAREFDVAVLCDVLRYAPLPAQKLLAEAARVARYVVIKDRFERERYAQTMPRLTRDAFIRSANEQRLVITAFDGGLALSEHSPLPRSLVPESSFVAVLCHGLQ